jgi:hypothetical protein
MQALRRVLRPYSLEVIKGMVADLENGLIYMFLDYAPRGDLRSANRKYQKLRFGAALPMPGGPVPVPYGGYPGGAARREGCVCV